MNRRQALALSAAATTVSLLSAAPAAAAPKSESVRLGRDQMFDHDWKFFRGAGAFEAPDLDDGGWRIVDLPHDWSIEDLPPEAGSKRLGPFDPAAVGGTATAFTVGGEGWYRKHFSLAGVPSQGQVEVLFDGVYRESDVWLNGTHLGRRVHGYAPFAYDLTPHLRAGDNVLAVRVRNIGRNSRWYAGSGIYRSVTIDVTPEPVRVKRWGVAVSTRRITDAAAEIAIETALVQAAPDIIVVSRIRDASGAVVLEAPAPASDKVEQVLSLAAPQLWSPDSPALYTLETELRRAGALVDKVTTPFGVRIITFAPDRGMELNGVPTKLRGGCVHHDNGLLGAAAYPDADDRRVRLLKARGYNALRSSHNPASRSLADACDRHGMMLIEEAFDMWRTSKNPQDYANDFAENWKADLSAMVLSARNHPSVIMWSIGNEVPHRSTPEGVRTGWELANQVRSLDPSRPVTAAINGFAGRPVIADAATARPGFAGVPDESAAIFLDVVGYNYKLDRYASDHARYPNRVIYGSESFPKEVFDTWAFIEKHPYVVGDFVWSATDYLGEAGMGGQVRSKSKIAMPMTPAWPWIVNDQGDLDITGERKPPSFARDVVWRVSPLEIAVLRPLAPATYEHVGLWGWSDERQSWSWPGHEGEPLTVRAYTHADRVELHLNGTLAAAKDLAGDERLPVELSVPYAAGVLEAVAYRQGREIGRRRLETVGAPAALRLTPETARGVAGRGRLSYVRVQVEDAHGRPAPDAVHKVQLAVTGPAKLVGFGSGDPRATGSFQSTEALTYDGRALAILRATGAAGTVRIVGRSAGLRSGSAAVALA